MEPGPGRSINSELQDPGGFFLLAKSERVPGRPWSSVSLRGKLGPAAGAAVPGLGLGSIPLFCPVTGHGLCLGHFQPSAQTSPAFSRRGQWNCWDQLLIALRKFPKRCALAGSFRRKSPFSCGSSLSVPLGPPGFGSRARAVLCCVPAVPWQQRRARRSPWISEWERRAAAGPSRTSAAFPCRGAERGVWENVRLRWLLPWESSREQLVRRDQDGEEVWELPECPLRPPEGLTSLGSCSLVNPLETALRKLPWPSTPAGPGPPFQGFSLINPFAGGVTFLGEGNMELFPWNRKDLTDLFVVYIFTWTNV